MEEEQEAAMINRKIAVESSWLCEMFQDQDLTPQDKSEIIRRVMAPRLEEIPDLPLHDCDVAN